MSNFIFVIPDDWVQLDWEYISNNVAHMAQADVMDYIATRNMLTMTEKMRPSGLIPEGQDIVDARLFDSTVFAVQFA